MQVPDPSQQHRVMVSNWLPTSVANLKSRASLTRVLVTRDVALSALLSATKCRQAEGRNAGGRSQCCGARRAGGGSGESHAGGGDR